MPFPLVPVIAAGANLLGQAFSSIYGAKSTERQNAASQAFSREMYERQRRDSLSDWATQNEYNSPKAQMARYREAGLNPNLIYGSGQSASSGQAQTPRSSTVEQPKFEAFRPDLSGLGNPLLMYQDARMKEAQIDNLEALNTVYTQDALLKAANVKIATVEQEKRQYETGVSRIKGDILANTWMDSVEQIRENLRKTQAQIKMTLDENERRALVNVNTLQEGVERIATLRLGRELTKEQKRSIYLDAELKQKELDLRRSYNLSSSDPVYIRMLTYFLDKLGFKP